MKTISVLLLALLPGISFAEKTPGPTPVAPAPLTCSVSGKELGSMGEPYRHTHKVKGKPDQTALLCCKHCIKKFDKAAAKNAAKPVPATPAPTINSDTPHRHSH